LQGLKHYLSLNIFTNEWQHLQITLINYFKLFELERNSDQTIQIT
jgi:hypothetical protein